MKFYFCSLEVGSSQMLAYQFAINAFWKYNKLKRERFKSGRLYKNITQKNNTKNKLNIS